MKLTIDTNIVRLSEGLSTTQDNITILIMIIMKYQFMQFPLHLLQPAVPSFSTLLYATMHFHEDGDIGNRNM
jgi:hypothetical protein